MFSGATDASCQQLSNAEWAARCEEQLRLHQSLGDYRFFTPLLERIGALNEPGARPFEWGLRVLTHEAGGEVDRLCGSMR